MTSSSRIMSEDEFVGLVRSAAVQMAIMRAWNDDQRMTADGWQTIYAADADIFALYGNPADKARQVNGRLGYGQVFDSDPPAKAAALAERLADYICFELTGGRPLFVIPPIDKEVRSQINALSLRLGREPAAFRVDVSRMEVAINALTQAIGSTPPHDVLTAFSSLLGLRGQSPQVEYRRLNRLFEEQRLVSTHSIKAHTTVPDAVTSLFLRENDLGEIYDHIVRAESWLERILPTDTDKISRPKFANFKNDSEALARLEIWNEKLAKKKIRLVYITGAVHLLQAGRKFEFGETDFSKRFIRHPRYFMASRDVIASVDGPDLPPYAASEFYGWIQTFLGRLSMSDDELQREDHFFQLSPEIESAAKSAFRSSPDIGTELKEKWQSYLSELESSYLPPEDIVTDIVNELRAVSNEEAGLVERWNAVRSQLNDTIENERDLAWDACFSTAVKAGFFVNTGAIPSQKMPSRRLPPLKFDSWKKTESFVAQMSQWRSPDDVDAMAYQNGLSAMKDETLDDFKYAYFLSHAALFAARSDWRVGAILALRATDKAVESKPNEGTLSNGRESNFLAGYCLRHSARNSEECLNAKTYIIKALEIFRKEKRARPHLDIVSERFTSEIFACEVSSLLFRYFGEKSNDKPVKGEMLDIRKEIVKELEKISLKNEQSKYIDDVIVRESCNILMLSALISVFDTDFQYAGTLLSKYLNDDHARKTLFSLTMLYFYQSIAEKSPSKKILMAHYREVSMSHKIFPYDEKRFEFLQNLTLS
jgi:hypothetical protein